MKRKSLLYHLGNVLIALSLLSFAFIFYPLITVYLFPAKPVEIKELRKEKGIFIAIPKIRAQSPVIANVDPWNEIEYQQALKRGVAHAKGTILPGEKSPSDNKNNASFLFAHSSGTPWELTHTNTIFLRLGELVKGDTIHITNNGQLFTYVVYDKKEVWPNEIEYLQINKKDELILQTCTPIGTSLKRLLVFAKIKK